MHELRAIMTVPASSLGPEPARQFRMSGGKPLSEQKHSTASDAGIGRRVEPATLPKQSRVSEPQPHQMAWGQTRSCHLSARVSWSKFVRRRPAGSQVDLSPQFHSDFGFRDAVRILPYLHELGITDCYASPYLKARPGSRHGYDITDHAQLNPEVSKDDDYSDWLQSLKRLQMGQILDVVPNHMAVVGNENNWWNDVLENGPASPYANYFDIAWSSSPRPELQGRVLIPILGETYAKVLEAQQLRLEYADGAFFVHYFDHRFPVAPRSYGLILNQGEAELESFLGADSPETAEYQSILTAIKHLPRSNELDPARLTERRREKEVIKRRLAELTNKSARAKAIDKTVAASMAKPVFPAASTCWKNCSTTSLHGSVTAAADE